MERKSELIYGFRPVMEAIKSGKEIDRVLMKNHIKGELFGEFYDLIKTNQVPFQYVPEEKLNRLTRKNHQGVVAFISPVEYTETEQLLLHLFSQGIVPLILVLDKITDVRNLGAIARTAECAGVHGIVFPTKGSAQINSDGVKASAGALLKIPLCRSKNLANTITYLKDSGLQIVAATEKTDSLYYTADFTCPTAIIMGSEENGVAPEYLKLSDKLVKIPISGTIESLNVSVAAAVLIYEAVRQRYFQIH